MTCKTMKQNENDQNHKKESTPVVDDKPNGKSQINMFNRLPVKLSLAICFGRSL